MSALPPAPGPAPPGQGTSTTGAGASAHFVSKWLERNPEMVFARVFCPPPMRGRFDAWGALLHELGEARLALREPTVAQAKTSWWIEELRALAAGAPRHPLGRDLLGVDAPWLALARALLAEGMHGEGMHGGGLAADGEASLARLAGLADAAVGVEAALFDATPGEAAARALAVHWRLHALPRSLAGEDAGGLPMGLLARHGLTQAALADALPVAVLRDWATVLQAALPAVLPGAALAAQARWRFDRRRLARLAARGDTFDAGAAPVLAWQAWRAARDASLHRSRPSPA